MDRYLAKQARARTTAPVSRSGQRAGRYSHAREWMVARSFCCSQTRRILAGPATLGPTAARPSVGGAVKSSDHRNVPRRSSSQPTPGLRCSVDKRQRWLVLVSDVLQRMPHDSVAGTRDAMLRASHAQQLSTASTSMLPKGALPVAAFRSPPWFAATRAFELSAFGNARGCAFGFSGTRERIDAATRTAQCFVSRFTCHLQLL